jgi:hypothetical protein
MSSQRHETRLAQSRAIARRKIRHVVRPSLKAESANKSAPPFDPLACILAPVSKMHFERRGAEEALLERAYWLIAKQTFSVLRHENDQRPTGAIWRCALGPSRS